MVVADVGTGTGFVAAGIAPRVAKVIGIDISERILDVARQNLDELAIDNVDLREGDITALPLPDNSVDAAFANMVLHHAEDPAAMLAEMARVVRPCGVVAICDEVEHPWAWMREEHADIWLGFTPEQVHAFFAAAGLEPFLSLLAGGSQGAAGALGVVLGAEHLELAYWMPGAQRWVDQAGNPRAVDITQPGVILVDYRRNRVAALTMRNACSGQTAGKL